MSLSDSWANKQPLTARVGAAEAVLADLRAAIESGELQVGTRLPSEASLATRFGVSRSVVREALRSTTTLGLTETHTGKGTFVLASAVSANPTFGDHSVTSLREARPHIEVPAASLAAIRRSPEQLAALHSLIDSMDTTDDPKLWVRLDAELHALIAQCSGNDVFSGVIDSIRAALAGQSEMVNLLPDRQRRSNVEHREIVERIDAGDEGGAGLAMSTHLGRVQSAIEELGRDSHKIT